MSVLAETNALKILGKKKLHQMVDTKSPSTFKRLKVDSTRNFPQNCGPFVRENNGTREIYPEFPSTTKPVNVESRRNFPENCVPFVCENNGSREIYPEIPSNTKRVKVDATRSFPENCGPFVLQNNGTTGIHPEFPSTTKPVNVDAMRNFPENCGPCVLQEKNGSDTQCSADTEIKSCSEVAMIESAEPLSVFVPSNFEAKRDDLAATGAHPKEAGDSSHLNTSCQPTNGNQPLKMKEENLMYDESTQLREVLVNQVLQKPSIDTGNTCDWFIKGEPIENGPVLFAIVSQENLIEVQNDEPSTETTKRVHYEEVSDDESRSKVDDDEICILSCSEWNSQKSGLKTPSAGKKCGKGKIVQDEAARCPQPLQRCKIVTEDESVSQEDLRNSVVTCGVSGHGLLTEYEHIQKVKEVRETLKLFDDVYTKLLKAEKHEGRSKRRIHIETAMTLKNQKKWVNCEWTFGHVPGVEIGDQFRFRAELVTIGLHHQFIKGISYVNIDGKDVATSIVDSGRYENETISSETFIYVGQGGNSKVFVNVRVEDQKLEGGNLALKNSMDLGYPVRVICGRQRVNGKKSDIRYIYDGLYTVTKCWEERAPTGKYVFKFELKRNLGQPKLTCKLVSQPANLVKVNHFRVKKATKSIMQSEFIVDYDVSQGKEKIPIPAINAINDERPPPFAYITNMKYPDWYYISMPQGCNCTSGCSDSEQCSCASRNGGEIPFNTRGSIIRAQPLVYECGPSCKCPPSCKNRVSQHGPRYNLEVFMTESRGWGLRSRDHVSSGSFICEYVGELLDEKEAENRIDHDEYLFDIGNYDEEIPKRNVARTNNLKFESNSLMRKDEDGFTLDALRYGNVGRFINHSCSPNLYAQNVMYYHGDRRVPHIMFFASESIAPLEELTYHYNYHIDHVYDKNGSMKRENSKCGSRKCEGRMY
ncbi:histone-lysine N-methyltransferase, H3 lysine-9 specific SUVH5-like [Solanum dulcamara]|uniref:histone-lysine N-methyltransferase, H3 lysine-9 specific SUVH5-like n=1 Tax=Solanum dulcamara TaxID=45834 RepID=UPI00248580E2|nr:histone-lysine N-methyltransferase, H3 lysine-9 specific SUVH5-like [Solanum dulcamara]